jgi:hypothetical protein
VVELRPSMCETLSSIPIMAKEKKKEKKFLPLEPLPVLCVWVWGLNSKLCARRAGSLPPEPHFQSIYSGYLEMGVSQTICLGWP